MLSFLLSLWRNIIKFVQHLWTGNCEIYRICNGWHNDEMTIEFLTTLSKSKVLCVEFRQCVIVPNLFDVDKTAQNVMIKKKIGVDSKIVLMNITHCFHSLRSVNAVIINLIELKNTSYNAKNSCHTALLDDLWKVMKPNIRRKNGMITDEWGEIGFQGKDPATDFRGMGLLGLHQLVYLGKYHNSVAQGILIESMHPRRYFPYAATGINITAFVIELLLSRHLHKLLLSEMENFRSKIFSSFTDGPSVNEQLVNLGCAMVNKVYCEVFQVFTKLWVDRDPPDIMSFLKIFSECKSNIIKKYPSI